MSATPASNPQNGNCGINFALQGDSFSATNTCRDYLAIALIGKQENGSVNSYSYFINLFDAERIFAPLAGAGKKHLIRLNLNLALPQEACFLSSYCGKKAHLNDKESLLPEICDCFLESL